MTSAIVLCTEVDIPALEQLCGGRFGAGRDGAVIATVFEPGDERGTVVRVDRGNCLDDDDDAELATFARSISVDQGSSTGLAREVFDLVSKSGPALLLADYETVVARTPAAAE